MMVPLEHDSQCQFLTVEDEWLAWASLQHDLQTALGGKLEIDSPIYELLVSDPTTCGWLRTGFLKPQVLCTYPEICWLNLLHPVFQGAITAGHYTQKEILGFCSEWVLDTLYYKALCQMPVRALLLSGVVSFQRFLSLTRFQLKMLSKSRSLCLKLLSGRMTMPEFLRISPMQSDRLLDELVEPVSLL